MANDSSDIRNKVLARIEAGKVHMHPRAYFVAQVVLVLALCVLILGISIFIATYGAFILRIGGHHALLGFGTRGLTTFLLIFPWQWVLLDILLIAVTAYLVRRFRWGYRRPGIYVAGAFLLVALVLGWGLDEATPFNDQLLQRADHEELPGPLHDLYEHAHQGAPHDHGVFRGIVTGVGTSTLTIAHDDFDHDEDDGNLVVIPPSGTDLDVFHVGERVYVAGTPSNGMIAAYGIQELSPVPED